MRSNNYTVIYKRCGQECFRVHVNKFLSSCWNTVEISAEITLAINGENDTKPAF
jgi:hypothetical protein